jgi:hypothetical protein
MWPATFFWWWMVDGGMVGVNYTKTIDDPTTQPIYFQNREKTHRETHFIIYKYHEKTYTE